jgi:hypothetical protein
MAPGAHYVGLNKSLNCKLDCFRAAEKNDYNYKTIYLKKESHLAAKRFFKLPPKLISFRIFFLATDSHQFFTKIHSYKTFFFGTETRNK